MPLKKTDFIGNARARDKSKPDAGSSLGPVRFVKSAAALADLPLGGPPEVAFAGRSNAGKSSAINALAGRKRLAFVSKQPGRTQLINFFAMADDQAYLVDLPGYGYAAVPSATRVGWEALIGGYLQSRTTLCGVVVIMDIRHPLTALDRQLLDWLQPMGVRVLVLLSKADKLSRQQGMRALTNLARALAVDRPNYTVQLFSSLRGTGVEQATKTIRAWIREGAVHKKPPVKGE